MSVTPSSSSKTSYNFRSIDSQNSFKLCDSSPTFFKFPEMSPPKTRKEGVKVIQEDQQHPHTNYASSLKADNIEITLRMSVCDAPMRFRRASENKLCYSIVPNHAAFYTTVIEHGIGIPLHPFFIDVLDFYNLASAQLSPMAWCHMLGTLILFRQEGMGVPTLMEWC